MAVQLSAAVRQAEADAQGALHDGGFICYFTGTPPATIELAATGTKVAEFSLPTPAFAAATDNGSSATATANPIATTNAIATGLVTYYRSYTSAGSGADPANTLKQGTITATAGGGDMEITDPNITNNEPLSIGSWTYTQPRQ